MSDEFYTAVMRILDPRHEPTMAQGDVICSMEPTILVTAGAGAGKTTTMANRIVYQVVSGNVKPSEVLGLTFTRKAASGLAEKITESLGVIRRHTSALMKYEEYAGNLSSFDGQPTVSTYDSFAGEIVATYGVLAGINTDRRLITDAERMRIMKDIVSNLQWSKLDPLLREESLETIATSALSLSAALVDHRVSLSRAEEFLRHEIEKLELLLADPTRFTQKKLDESGFHGMTYRGCGDEVDERKTLSALWSRLKTSGLPSLSFRLHLLPVVEKYWEAKVSEAFCEFADNTADAIKILEDFPDVAREYASRFRLVLLDEYQDTSVSQARLLHLAVGKPDVGGQWRSVCAVGDPNQAIYGWRGASAGALEDFARDFGTSLGQATRINLLTSFRNSQHILGAANVTLEKLNTKKNALELEAFAGAPNGCVSHIHTDTRDEQYQAIALRIRDIFRHYGAQGDPSKQPEVAVLCRQRNFFAPLGAELKKYGIPYEVIGGDRLILQPEILTVRAFLACVSSPLRSDGLARLVSHYGIAKADIEALNRAHKAAHKEEQRVLRYTVIKNGKAGDFLGERVDNMQKQSADDERNVQGVSPEKSSSARENHLSSGEVDLEALGLLETLMMLESRPSGMSEEGYRRLSILKVKIAALREQHNLPLSRIIRESISTLGLDIAAASRATGGPKVRNILDSFVALAGEYERSNPGKDLADFLEWIDDVERYEKSGEEIGGEDFLGEGNDIEVQPGIVQIMTVHAAKGLEWNDLVVVPELVHGGFAEGEKSTNWLVSKSAFPFPLRQDYKHLPHFSVAQQSEKITAGIAYYEYLKGSLLQHEAAEIRRLAYVAFTRPKTELLLTSYNYKESYEENPLRVPIGLSVFAEEIEESSSIPVMHNEELSQEDWPENLKYCAPVISEEGESLDICTQGSPSVQGSQALQGETTSIGRAGSSTSAVNAEVMVSAVREEKAGEEPENTDNHRELNSLEVLQTQEVSKEEGRESEIASLANNLWPDSLFHSTPSPIHVKIGQEWELWERQAEILIEEHRGTIDIPEKSNAYYTASDIVALAREPEVFRRHRLRPIPTRTHDEMRLGTLVHDKIAEHFLKPSILDIDMGDEPVSDPRTRKQATRLFERFLSSPWSQYPVIAVEEQIEITISGRAIRCKFDAVFDTSFKSEGASVTVVDWKTGRKPHDEEDLRARELQLQLYRLAWSRARNIPLEEISATFVYLGHPEGPQEHAPLAMEEEELLDLLSARIEQVEGDGGVTVI